MSFYTAVMQLLPLQTPLLQSGDPLPVMLQRAGSILDGDIVVISSKAIATVEDAAIDTQRLIPSKEAEDWSEKTGRSAQFCEVVLQELKRLNGKVIGFCPGALLTELRPQGLRTGVIQSANAGLDESNIKAGSAIGWPIDPVMSAKKLREELGEAIAVIITDSCIRPRRKGIIAQALAVSGIDPFTSAIGSNDLFGKPLRITTEATADQLATAANTLMGNAGQSIPAVVIRDHGLPLSDYTGWVDGIEPEEDLFKNLF